MTIPEASDAAAAPPSSGVQVVPGVDVGMPTEAAWSAVLKATRYSTRALASIRLAA